MAIFRQQRELGFLCLNQHFPTRGVHLLHFLQPPIIHYPTFFPWGAKEWAQNDPKLDRAVNLLHFLHICASAQQTLMGAPRFFFYFTANPPLGILFQRWEVENPFKKFSPYFGLQFTIRHIIIIGNHE